MKLSIFFEIQCWKQWMPWKEGFEHKAFWDALKLVDAAEKLGFDTLWMAEHHLLPEYSHSSAPDVFLGAVSQRTSRIKLGHAVVLLPRSFNHVIRVAERTATLDILSNGRLEVGTGRSVTELELQGFEIDPDDSTPMWDEAIRLLPRLWTEEVVSHQGKYYNFPPRTVVPKPVQKPHPPLWLAGTNPATFKKAGEFGVGMIGFPIGTSVEDVAVHVREYREAIKTCKPAGRFINDRVVILLGTLIGNDDKKAIEQYRAHDETLNAWTSKNFGVFTQKKSQAYAYYEQIRKEAAKHPAPTYESRIDGGAILAGDPRRAIDTLERYKALGIDQALLWFECGGVPFEEAMKSIKLVGEKVLPHFHTG